YLRYLSTRNLTFDADEESLHQFFANFGEIEFAKIVKDKLTLHSRGTAFVKFKSKQDAETVLIQSSKAEHAHRFVFAGRLLNLSLAVSRDEVSKLQKARSGEEPASVGCFGGRNLHLARIGLIRPGSRAAEGLTATELAMRESVIRTKQAKLRNPSIFISPLRLCLRNIPLDVDNKKLRRACQKIAGSGARITECRVMRDIKSGAQNPKSLGYAFVAFEEHKDALKTLQVLNNNNGILGGNRKPIVEFSLENSKALEKKRRRALKSQMVHESKLVGGQTSIIRQSVRASKIAKKQKLRKKGKTGTLRILPKKLGPKIRHKRASKKK
uniref:RNA-binding protein 28 n=1 Tax=Mesocestoides corti TaxID=53468 RepID=A0A5K3F6J6_MESCO